VLGLLRARRSSREDDSIAQATMVTRPVGAIRFPQVARTYPGETPCVSVNTAVGSVREPPLPSVGWFALATRCA